MTEEDIKRFNLADLSKFEDEALLAALALVGNGIENKVDVDPVLLYATYGKISYELDERGH